jgi:hypothetical protein
MYLGHDLNVRGLISGTQEIFFFSKTYRQFVVATQFSTQGTQRAKRQGSETNHPTPSSAEVKNVWRYTSAPPICLHGVHRNNFVVITIANFSAF